MGQDFDTNAPTSGSLFLCWKKYLHVAPDRFMKRLGFGLPFFAKHVIGTQLSRIFFNRAVSRGWVRKW
ncbi:MAG: hypothetical protein EBT90_04930 [Rhodobacteraceae bacterium]|nr:hypothetical protein [Paracoccaceae bacterium]